MKHLKTLAASAAFLAVALTNGGDALPTKDTPAVAPEEALRKLIDGNKRYVSGKPERPHQASERRQELSAGQHPFAIVLSCADSRVAPELIFDQGLGDLFVLRNAGNVLDDHTIGSIEYAVEHLHSTLIIVVGHEKCGAVKATVDGGHAPGHIHSVVESIQPALEACKDKAGDKVDLVVRANAQRVAAQLQRVEPILGTAVQAGHLKIVPARYDLDTGEIELLN